MLTMFKYHIYAILFLLCTSTLSAQQSIEDYEALLKTELSKKQKLVVLDSLIHKIDESNPVKSASYAEEFVDIALKERQYEDAIRVAVKSVFYISTQLSNPDRAGAVLSKVEPYRDSIDNNYLKGALHLKKGGIFFNGRGFDNASENYLKSLEFFGEKDSIYIADAIYFYGQAQSELGNHLAAIQNYQKANKIYKQLNDELYVNYTEEAIISAYGVNGFDHKTIEIRNRLIERVKKNGKGSLAQLYFNQALNYKSIGNTQKQEECLLNAVKFIDSQDPEVIRLKVSFLSALTVFYAEQGELSKSLDYLHMAANVNENKTESTFWGFRLQFARANYYYYNKEYTKSIETARNLEKDALRSNKITLIIDVRKLLSKNYSKVGNNKEAYNYLKSHKKLEDSIFNVKKTNALSFYQSQFETERRLKELTEQESKIMLMDKEIELKSNRNKLYVSVLILLVFTLLSGYLFLRYRSKQKQKLHEIELQGHKSALEVYTKELLRSSSSLAQIKKELEDMKKENRPQEDVNRLQDLINFRILTPEHWEDFKTKFNRVYPTLFTKARLVNNAITTSEERLIALEKLNLKTNEIANILGVSPDSITKLRYRLRKKLGISREISIATYIEAA